MTLSDQARVADTLPHLVTLTTVFVLGRRDGSTQET